jgi:FkbM family methyltransferase
MKTAVQPRTGFGELARQRIRGALGYQSLPYRIAARILDLGSTLLSEGLKTTMTLQRLKASAAIDVPAVAVKFKRLEHPISLRPGSRDVETLISNAVRLEYGQLVLEANAPHFVVDGGAYIGDTSSYFLSQYPRATVVALEPNPESFEIAKKNLEPYGERVMLLNKALAEKNGTLFLSGSETGAKVGPTGTVSVECATVADLIAMSATGRISVLKLDIEGAEEALFSNDARNWLDKVDHIIVETHGPNCEKAVLAALKAADWNVRRYRNLYYCSAT